jgi:hypothetical protein
MKLVKWAQAQSLILPFVKDCPWPMAEVCLQQAAREFFERSYTWRVWTDDLYTIAGLAEYDLFVGKGAEVSSVIDAIIGGRKVQCFTQNDWGYIQADVSSASGVSWFESQLHINPVPKVDELPIKALVSLRPDLNIEGLPETQWEYITKIVLGALARIYGATDKPYSNPGEATKHELMFQSAYFRERSKAEKSGFTRSRVVGHYL